MLVPFASLPDHARLWIYQSDRKFNSLELSTISEALGAFISRWGAHGTPLKASFDILYDQFIILAVDEQSQAASGCSIDDSTRTIKQLGEDLGIDLFDRTKVAFYIEGAVMIIALAELKRRYLDGTWRRDSMMINTLVPTKAEFDKGHLVPAELTWLKRYLPNEKVAG